MASFQVQRYAFSNATADDYQIVTGLTGKKIGVVSYHLGAAGTNTVKFTDEITDEVQTVTLTGSPLFKTSEGKGLSVTLGSSNSVAGYINYVILDER